MGWGPKAPNMSGANALAREQAAISREQWEDYKTEFGPLAKEEMRNNIDVSRRLADSAIAAQDYQLGLQRRYDDRYWGVQVPLEDMLITEAREFDTDAERERMAADAQADVRSGYGRARGQMMRELASRGVDPSSGAALSAMSVAGSDEAAAMAAAMNKTREAARQLGWAKKLDAASLAKGLPGFSSSSSQVALGWNGAGLNAGGAGMQGVNQTAGARSQAAGVSISGLGGASANLRANAIESAKNPGFDALMGVAAGGLKLAGMYYGSRIAGLSG